jgi:hypothetical protein
MGKGCHIFNYWKWWDNWHRCCAYVHVIDFGNYILPCNVCFWKPLCVSNGEKHLTTSDSGIVATFEQECVSRPNDQWTILANLEYVGWIEELLAINYGVLNIIVLFYNWVKANYIKSNTTIKRDEYGFTLMNFNSLIPISNQSFAFPIDVE